MGLFDKFVPSSKKLSTIRQLAAMRLTRLPAFSNAPYIELERQLESLPAAQVMGLPEATIVQILETVSTESRLPWNELALRIEQHRSPLGAVPNAASNTPFEYAIARYLVEHEDPGKGVTRAWAVEAADYAASAYGVPATVRLELSAKENRHLLRECKAWRHAAQEYLDGITSDEEFMAEADLIMQTPIGEDDGSDGVRITR